MAESKLKVCGVGLGVVGTIFAAGLAESGAEIIATDLPHRIEQLDNHGLRVRWEDRKLQHSVRTVPSISDMADINPDVIFIATKTWSLEFILPKIAEVAGKNTVVISVQNGIGPEDVIAKYINPENVGRVVVNYAGANDASWTTRVNWFNPPNFISPFTERDDKKINRIGEMLNAAGLTTEVVTPHEIRKKAWLKTILNSALMPVCGVLGLTMAEAMTCDIIRGYAGDLVREGLAVAGKLGFHYGDDIWNECMAYLDKGGNHYPSMWVDLDNKLPTEIEFLNGKIIELGVQFDDVDLHINRVFTSLVVSREIKNKSRAPDDIPDYLSDNRISR